MSMRYPGGLIATSPVNARYPSGVWTQAQAIPYQAQNVWTRDQFWPYTTLLLQGDGAVNGAQNNTFLDSSSNNFTITRNGNTTQGAFTPYEANGYWSNYFDGSGDYLTLTGSSIGSNNYTVEAWIFPNVMTTFAIFSLGTSDTTGSMVFWVNSNGAINLYGDNTDRVNSATNRIVAGQWQHVALVRNSGTTTIYVNGSSVASSSSAYTSTNTTYQICAGYGGLNTPITGYVSNLRVVNGTAVYTSNFTPSTTPLSAITNTALLTCQSNRFVDNSGSNRAITSVGDTSVQAFQPFPGATTWSASVLGGSGYFDGSGDYLTAPSGAVSGLGTGDYTIEGWYYPTSFAIDTLYRRLWSFGSGLSDSLSLTIDDGTISAPGRLVLRFNDTIRITSSSSAVLNAWNHIAVVRSSGTTTIYLNGSSVGTSSTSDNLNTAGSSSLSIGAQAGTTQGSWSGFMGGVRVVKSTAVYTSTFTPPTAPPTAITNTSLLTNFSNAGIYDNSMMNNLETVGNAQVSTSVVKYGTGSMAFDGTGDYLYVPTNQNMNFGSGNFTIEMWIYPLSVSSVPYLIDGRSTSTAAENVVTLYVDSSQYVTYWVNGAVRITANSTVSLSAWSHVAVVKNGGITTMYLNGTPVGTWTDGTTYVASNYLIGQRTATSSQSWNGYIDDLRITKGAARYITTFTPPPARLPAQ